MIASPNAGCSICPTGIAESELERWIKFGNFIYQVMFYPCLTEGP